MKILFIIDSVGFGGAERQFVELIKGLHKKKYHEIHVGCLLKVVNGYTSIIESLGIKVTYFERNSRFDVIKPTAEIYRYINQNQIELVQTFMSMGSLLGATAARMAYKPVICSAIRDGMNSTLRESIIKRIIAFLSNILISNSYAGFNNRFKKMKPKFRVIYNGMDFSRFQIKQTNSLKLKKELGIEKFRRVVCMVASLSKNKDHFTLLEAISQVVKLYPKTGLLIVGDGPNKQMLSKTIKEYQIEDNVVLSGFRNDVDQIYDSVDICVLLTNTDNHLEGISNALTEAMVSQIPVIATKGGGTDELIKNMHTGVLVPSKNGLKVAQSIIHLLENEDERNKIALEGQKHIFRKFNLERYITEYETLYFQYKKKNDSFPLCA
jgi:glycosyltransferase involved in cell wall biosynthesis